MTIAYSRIIVFGPWHLGEEGWVLNLRDRDSWLAEAAIHHHRIVYAVVMETSPWRGETCTQVEHATQVGDKVRNWYYVDLSEMYVYD